MVTEFSYPEAAVAGACYFLAPCEHAQKICKCGSPAKSFRHEDVLFLVSASTATGHPSPLLRPLGTDGLGKLSFRRAVQ